MSEKFDKFSDLNEKLQKLDLIDEKLKLFQQNSNVFSLIYNFSGFLEVYSSKLGDFIIENTIQIFY